MQDGKDPKETAIARLQYTVDRACNFIHDGGSSYSRRARRAAKKGVEKATVLKGLSGIEAALKDAREYVEKVYSPKQEREVRESRVSLLG